MAKKKSSGFFDRIRRANEENLQRTRFDTMTREQEVGQCFDCKGIYPWSKLVDESTQEYQYVICANCIARRDPRIRS